MHINLRTFHVPQATCVGPLPGPSSSMLQEYFTVHVLRYAKTDILILGSVFKVIAQNWFNPLKTKRRPLYLKTHFVPRSKHFSSRL